MISSFCEQLWKIEEIITQKHNFPSFTKDNTFLSLTKVIKTLGET